MTDLLDADFNIILVGLVMALGYIASDVVMLSTYYVIIVIGVMIRNKLKVILDE